MLFKIVRGMVPAINADKVFTPHRNERQIRSKNYQDCQTSNFVDRYNLTISQCYKGPQSKKREQFRNSFFVKTVTDWNSLSDDHIRAETVNSLRTAVHSYVTSQ